MTFPPGCALCATLVLGSALCLTPAPEGGTPPRPDGRPLIEAQVTRVIDGMSLDARVSGNRTAVGYLGAETPAANQPCGQVALARNRELAGPAVLLEEDEAYQFDQLGRRLYYAYTLDGVWIEEALIREGLARAVRTDARHGAYLAAVQAEAEAAGRGCLWEMPPSDADGALNQDQN
jgi:endonuclease YncB( thermonuclease family)